MRMKRLLTGVLSAALLGATPIALAAAPAEAATVNTWIEGSINYSKAEYGKTVYLSGGVKSSTGYPAGNVVIQRKLAGQSSFTTVQTDTSAGYFSYAFRAQKNTEFRILYSGGTSGSDTYTPSSASTSLKVYRKLQVKTSYTSLTVKGKVTPDFKKKKFTVQVKKGKWKTWKKVKTNKKGKYAVKLVGSRKGIKYRFVVPGSKGFTKTQSGVITARSYRY